MMPLRYLLRRKNYKQVTRRLDLNMRARLRQSLWWLAGLSCLHVIAMVMFEGLAPDDALWLTATTLTTVGYGDLSAATPAGRTATFLLLYIAGITLLAQLASDYIDYRLQRKEYMIKGRWRWNMKDHILIINSPGTNPALYFERLVEQIRLSRDFSDCPILVLTERFPDGLPNHLRERGVVHYHGECCDQDSLAAVSPDQARAIIVLARDEQSRLSDSVTLDVILQLKEYCQSLPYTVVECVREDNRERVRHLGANATLRPIRDYPEIMVRALVAPGTEKILENLFSHHDDHAMRYNVTVENARWADVSCQLIQAGIGTLLAYVCPDGHVECHPAPDHHFNASALILMVREENAPSTDLIRECLASPAH